MLVYFVSEREIMEEKIVAQVPKDLLGTEFPKDAEGRVYHVGAKRGESTHT